MLVPSVVVVALTASKVLAGGRHGGNGFLTNVDKISQYWGQLSPYKDNPENLFGVQDVGLPEGCQIEQAHSLQRHAERFASSYFDDGPNNENFAAKVAKSNGSFTGPLSFLNSYTYIIGQSSLTGIGATTEFASGVSFWNQYGRILYDAKPQQLQYDPLLANGTRRQKPVLRTTSQDRIYNSLINWALGFFGSSYQETADPTLGGFTNGSLFDVVIIPEGGTENNTLASYDSCFADFQPGNGDLGDRDLLFRYVPMYLADATERMQPYAPKDFHFTVNDTYAMQSICAYENAYIASSDFCQLFTEDEWAGFEHTLDIEYYYDYSFGNPTGRAQGLGYLQELLARLTNQYIASSNSSVNSSLTDNPSDFPLGRPFYLDTSHDDILISVLTAMSLDYFHDPPSITEYPPDPERHWILSNITPFGSKLITEVVGCAGEDPDPVHKHRTYYTPGQYGYDSTNAPNKFVRMRLNNGILPLNTIRGGKCEGRTDGLCPLEDFVASQADAEEQANYDFACFANYTILDPTNGSDYDGAVENGTAGVVVHPGMLTAEYVEENL